MLMDPYVTARSVSTPLALLALVGAMQFLLPQSASGEEWMACRRQGLMLCCVALIAAETMHPLMGAYALGSVLLLGAALSESRLVRVWGTVGLGLTAQVMAAGLQLSAAPEDEIYRKVMLTRSYWFLSEWHWYEWVGLIAPVTILLVIALGRRREGDEARVGLVRMAASAGVIAMTVAMVFARTGMKTHLVARMQPLRIFQVVYVVMTLVLGALLGEWLLRRTTIRWVTAFSLLAGVTMTAERMTFPGSRHLELPGALAWGPTTDGGNQFEQAFAWIRDNTPKDAMFALDAEYITKPGEDAQSFRAIAERSVLPDFSKDGGVVTNQPKLAAAWQEGQAAQAGLDEQTDEERVARLKPLGVSWVVLQRDAVTRFACKYANGAAKVCRLP
jgi:hypothetical protein